MNIQFLLNVNSLTQSSIEDMKALLITHPYCSLFRIVALMKAKGEQHPLEKDWLETTSVYAPNRSYLFHLYRNGVEDPIKERTINRVTLGAIAKKFAPMDEPAEMAPLPKTSFASWKPTKPKPLEKIEPRKPMNEPTKEVVGEDVAAKLAEESIQSNTGIVSETLAKVFVAQGKKERAIEIYLNLSLKFPEKKAYFADLIKSLSD